MFNTKLNPDSYLKKIAAKSLTHKFLDNSTLPIYQNMVSFLLGTKPKKIKTKVLDWGSGKGHISFLLTKAGFNVTSADVYREETDSSFGQETPIIKQQKINIIALKHPFLLPFQKNSFDMVVSFGVLEHVDNDLESLREIHRILKKDGKFFFSFLPYTLSWTQRLAHLRGDYYHSRLYSISRIQKMAKEVGFRVEFVVHGQLFPKNSLPYLPIIEIIDRWLTSYTPLKYFATNLEGLLVKVN
jgi:2-polyprenyl-3-methyl-5-hydroxy-6-metoxy-1,4-benzoquinol methylase